MKTTLPSWMLCLCLALSVPAWAQRRPTQPGTPAPAREAQGERDRTITPQNGSAAPAENQGPRQTPTCEQARRNARYGIYFDKVDIEKLVQTVSDATCRTFILPENVRGKISIIGPENGRVEVDADSFYSAFLAALDANGLAVYPYGRFLKIVDKRSAKQNPIPTIVDEDTPYTTNEQMVTKLFKIKYVEVEPLRGVLQQLVSKDGDTIPYPPDTIIVNDVGSNIHRLERLINQLDSRSSSDEMRIIQVQYATAQDVANTIQKLFEAKAGAGGRPGQRPGNFTQGTPGQPPPGSEGVVGGTETGGAVTLSQIIPDERTNKLIVVASPAAFGRIQDLVREIDIPSGSGNKINVYPLENANSEELASTLQSLAQGTANRPQRGPIPAQPQGLPRAPAQAAELFSGEVKISADKGTNSLVIVASQGDYKNIVQIIQQLDQPRRQVFVEAVIMEVNLDRNSEFGINFHQGFSLKTDDGAIPGILGTNYSGGSIPPSFSLANLASMGGFLAGIQGPVLPELKNLGIDIPAFGVVLNAMQQSSDVNVLSTPHLLTSDNEEAEITVGQNVPFQSGFTPSALGASLGGAGAGAGAVNPSLLGSLGGLGSLYAPITRQNVELKLTVKPQINESDYIRLVITEQTEEIASTDPVLGPTTSKRSAKTTVIAKDMETVVIGGIMQDRTLESVSKVPVLGDIPLLGHLFRDTTRRKTKTNLLLFLTPYIIRGQEDFRRIFERKMKERQQFVEQFYGQVPGYDVAVDFSRKPGPLSRMNQSVIKEEQRVENGGSGTPNERVIRPNGSPAPGGAPSPSPARPGGEAPAPQEGAAPSPEGDQAPRNFEAPPEGSERSVPAPQPEVIAPSPDADAERLRIQPGDGE
ncbi:general secretion pathway protein D [Corallococcus coralloides DSM 2259]|uniref:General secretion pathway protein D n=1 Tax=Corallococcus coralloides (strain ATCC 25202 / DSM 2259 / NBRC 100086 / M2) TaxID=1144275 RepID=H8N0S0_CORCM|nr:type II secretion system secretin GspD [Corallococcus coralloides]AFE08988.1 general secretion pathway protein D [Corallococcus coralloides DSM 2259]